MLTYILFASYALAWSSRRTCTGGQVWKKCGTHCPDKCGQGDKNIVFGRRRAMFCYTGCRVGCQCPADMFETADGHCVYEIDCYSEECTGGKEFKSCGTACPNKCGFPPAELCTRQCVVGVCQCPKGLWETDEGECVEEEDCYSEEPESSEEEFTPPTCTGGKEFNTCWTACPKKCGEPAQSCTRNCVAGCQCPADMFETAYGHCVYENQCPEESSSSSSEEECTGVKKFKLCGTACPKKCGENPNQLCTRNCVAGCQCPPDMFETDGKCVDEKECPPVPSESCTCPDGSRGYTVHSSYDTQDGRQDGCICKPAADTPVCCEAMTFKCQKCKYGSTKAACKAEPTWHSICRYINLPVVFG